MCLHRKPSSNPLPIIYIDNWSSNTVKNTTAYNTLHLDLLFWSNSTVFLNVFRPSQKCLKEHKPAGELINQVAY